MVNHGRTLLLNRAVGAESILHEFIPPEYQPVVLTPDLTAVKNVLFGDSPDIFTLDYRARQLLTILHTNFGKYLLDLDSRITYLPFTAVKCDHPTTLPHIKDLPDSIKTLTHLFESKDTRFGDFKLLFNSCLFIDRIAGLTLAFIHKIEELHRAVEKCKILGVDRSLHAD